MSIGRTLRTTVAKKLSLLYSFSAFTFESESIRVLLAVPMSLPELTKKELA